MQRESKEIEASAGFVARSWARMEALLTRPRGDWARVQPFMGHRLGTIIELSTDWGLVKSGTAMFVGIHRIDLPSNPTDSVFFISRDSTRDSWAWQEDAVKTDYRGRRKRCVGSNFLDTGMASGRKHYPGERSLLSLRVELY